MSKQFVVGLSGPQNGRMPADRLIDGGQPARVFNRALGVIDKRWVSDHDYVTLSVVEAVQPFAVTYARIEADDSLSTLVHQTFAGLISATAQYAHLTLRRPTNWTPRREPQRMSPTFARAPVAVPSPTSSARSHGYWRPVTVAPI